MQTHICLFTNTHLSFKTHICLSQTNTHLSFTNKHTFAFYKNTFVFLKHTHLSFKTHICLFAQPPAAPATPPKQPTRWRDRVGPSPEAKKTLIFNVDAHTDNKSAAASAAAAAAAPVVTQPVYIQENGEVDYDAIPALVVLRNPDKYLKNYVHHKVSTLPDMTDRVEYKPSDLCFWQKNTSGKVTKGPHKILPGMCAKWLHKACDFCIAKGYYPVMFEKRGELIDLTVQFITVQHMVYVACMNGSPSTTSNAAIKVLKYLLMNSCLLYTSPSPRDGLLSRMPSSA